DQGREMARHAEITQRTGVAIFFCDPHSPWQRGSNENINGLIRQYLPKGTNLSVHSQEELDAIALQLNMRPRKRFDFKCPIEVVGEVMQNAMAMRHDASASITVLHSAPATAKANRDSSGYHRHGFLSMSLISILSTVLISAALTHP